MLHPAPFRMPGALRRGCLFVVEVLRWLAPVAGQDSVHTDQMGGQCVGFAAPLHGEGDLDGAVRVAAAAPAVRVVRAGIGGGTAMVRSSEMENPFWVHWSRSSAGDRSAKGR